MTVHSWNPTSAQNYLGVSWNREGTTLPAGQVSGATITLVVDQAISHGMAFSFDITITGTE